jgi:hypothetical protein
MGTPCYIARMTPPVATMTDEQGCSFERSVVGDERLDMNRLVHHLVGEEAMGSGTGDEDSHVVLQ